jgi:hypothetical protein
MPMRTKFDNRGPKSEGILKGNLQNQMVSSGVGPKSPRPVRAAAVLALALLLAAATSCSRQSHASLPPGTMPEPATNGNVTYAADIKPIFDTMCIECHGPRKQKSGLRLDSREAAIHGNDDGPVFEVGKSLESILVTNIARVGKEDDWMPPADKAKPLSLEQVALIRAWIDQGAK